MTILSSFKRLYLKHGITDERERHVDTSTIMTLNHFHDFYFLQALLVAIQSEYRTNPEQSFRRAAIKLENDVREYSEYYFENIALRTFMYLYAVCFGEARHARDNVAQILFVPQTLELNRTSCYDAIPRYRPTKDNINTLVRVFDQKWSTAFGGKAWRDIAEALRFYNNVPSPAFIDHVIDLEHNGGCVFNKSDAEHSLFFNTDGTNEFKGFLDYKFRRNILERPPHYTDSLSITRKTMQLIQRYSVIFQKNPVKWVHVGNDSLSEYQVNWGNESLTVETKWREWAGIQNGNKPSVSMLMRIGGLANVHANKTTVEQQESLAKTAIKTVKKQLKEHMTKELLQEFEKRVQEWLQYSKKYACLPKCETLYSVIPCKVRTIGAKIEILIPLPWQGVGEKTSYGFRVEAPSIGIPYIVFDGKENGYNNRVPQFTDCHIVREYGMIRLYTKYDTFTLSSKELETLFE